MQVILESPPVSSDPPTPEQPQKQADVAPGVPHVIAECDQEADTDSSSPASHVTRPAPVSLQGVPPALKARTFGRVGQPPEPVEHHNEFCDFFALQHTEEVLKTFPCTVRKGSVRLGYHGTLYICNDHLCVTYRPWAHGDTRNFTVPYQLLEASYGTTIRGLPLKLKIMFRDGAGLENWYSLSFWSHAVRNLALQVINVQRKLHGGDVDDDMSDTVSATAAKSHSLTPRVKLPFDLAQPGPAPALDDEWVCIKEVELEATPQRVFSLALGDKSKRMIRFLEAQGMTSVKLDGHWRRDPEGDPAYVRIGRFFHPKNGVQCTQEHRASVYENEHLVLEVHQTLQGKPGTQFIHIFRRWDLVPLKVAEGSPPRLLFRAHLKVEFDRSRLANFLPKDMIRNQTKTEMLENHEAFLVVLKDWLSEPEEEVECSGLSLADRVLSKSRTLQRFVSKLVTSVSTDRPVDGPMSPGVNRDLVKQAAGVQAGVIGWGLQLLGLVVLVVAVVAVERSRWASRVAELEMQVKQLVESLEQAQSAGGKA